MKLQNKRKRVLQIAGIIIVVCLIGLLLYGYLGGGSFFEKSEVVILEEGSFLNDFEVIGDAVYIRCTVSLENRGSDPATVKLVGDFSQEVEGGLLKEGTLAGHFVEQDADRIQVDGNSQLKYLEVEFVGKFAGNAKMSSKLFPAITVMEVKGE